MTDNASKQGLSCATVCWILAAILGLLVLAICTKWLGYYWLFALVVGFAVFAVAGYLLPKMFCSDEAAVVDLSAPEAEETKPAATLVQPVKVVAEAAAAPVVEEKVEAPAPKAKKPTAKKAAKPAAKAKKAAPAKKPAGDGKPEMLTAARDGGADDLKMIKGVGPALEKMLNGMGVFHFDQVAGWKAAEVKWVDENMGRFSGRVKRDDWIKQAKLLAKGGETEFSKRAKKDDIYD